MSDSNVRRGPLAGIRVIELGVVIAGPTASALLADWGADVVKVEPFEGDPQRANGISQAYFQLDNRGKRSITLDLKSARAQEILLSLIDGADVFVSNMRASALRRLGADPASLTARNPRLVYGFISGYGSTGPAADKPGYDIGAFWSRSGMAGAFAGPGGEPPVPRPGIGDHTAGLALAAAIVAALFERERTGKGDVVDSSLYRVGTFLMGMDIGGKLNGVDPKVGLRRAHFNPLMACYRAGDDRWFWLLALQAERHWPSLQRAIERPDLGLDERFSSFWEIINHCDDLMAILDEEFAKRPLNEWEVVFAREDVWWDPVLDMDGVLADEVFAAATVSRPMDDGVRFVAPPFDHANHPQHGAGAAPELGQHTEDILLELGFDWNDITALKDERVIP